MITYALTATEFSARVTESIVIPIIVLLGILAFVWFIIGGLRNMSSVKNSSKDRSDAFKRTMWMILGLFVLISAGLILSSVARLVGSDTDTSLEGVRGELTPDEVFLDFAN